MINSERALVLAPSGRDRQVAQDLLRGAGYEGVPCETLASLLDEVRAGAGVAIITDEAVEEADLRPVSRWLDGQPPWSDFPFIILTKRTGAAVPPRVEQFQAVFGNVIFLERPFHATALTSAVGNALRGRRRQYQARAFLEDLSEGEKRLSTALRAGHMGSWELDTGSGALIASEQCKANFGREAGEDFTYQALRDSIAPNDRSRVDAEFAKSLSTGHDYIIEHRVIWPDGTEHWIEMRARVLLEARGQAPRLVGVSSDITARKTYETERDRLLLELASERERTQEALRGERALSGLLMTSVPAGIIAYDRDLQISVWNPVMERLVGIDADLVIGRPLFEVIAPDRALDMQTRVDDALKGVPGPIEELEFDTEDVGKVWLEVQHAPLRGGDGEIVGGVAFFRDMTERRRAEEQLRHAQKMETIGQLTGGVAHDFNNLLAAVLGNLEMLRKRLPVDPQLYRLIDGATQGAQRGASLTQRLLAFARRQDLQPVPTDLGKLVEGMRGLIERSLGALVGIDIDVPEGLPPATIDANQLELAILNLAVNARDAMPEGGLLSIRLREELAHGGESELNGRFLCLTVSDTGMGMDAATLKSAIEPFFSTKEVGKGTGLGLSMVHGLAEQLGGALKLSSQVGKGTVAEIWLPVADRPVEEEIRVPIGSTELRASRILIVDDDALIAMNTVDMVEDLGHTVLEAFSGMQALEILQSDAEVDALITDYAMPGMTGVELATAARRLRPELPILLATGYADLPSGTTTDLPRLAKPFQQHDLALQLSMLLGGEAAERPKS